MPQNPYLSDAEVNAFCERYVSNQVNFLEGHTSHIYREPFSRSVSEPMLTQWGGDSSEEYDRKWGFRE